MIVIIVIILMINIIVLKYYYFLPGFIVIPIRESACAACRFPFSVHLKHKGNSALAPPE